MTRALKKGADHSVQIPRDLDKIFDNEKGVMGKPK